MSQTVPSTSPSLLDRYEQVRQFSNQLTETLSPEDCMVQSMEDVSPTRWHLAHTTWFFETFLLSRRPEYVVYDEQFNYLFNSYYNQVGAQFPRPQRGNLSRPGLEAIRGYRRYVDRHLQDWLADGEWTPEERATLEVGLNHEQQHQELMLTDIKHVLSCNPTFPAYQPEARWEVSGRLPSEQEWFSIDEGIYHVGDDGEAFSFDNEHPRHRVFLEPFSIATHPVPNQTVIEFIEDGGYQRPHHWLSLGWDTVATKGWEAPLYWRRSDEGHWQQFTLAGLREVDPAAPACHLSYFEADAIARWAGYRLPTEFEWEVVAACTAPTCRDSDQFADRLVAEGRAIHPRWQLPQGEGPEQLWGAVWEWTGSSYAAYPGYRPPAGAIGEYNGKFMCNQYVLRGGSVATSSDHMRATYRNFFPPQARWQFSGFRFAR